MREILGAIAGCALALVAAYGLGRTALRIGGVTGSRARGELLVASTLCGLPLLSMLMFALATAQLLTRPLIALCSLACFALSFLPAKSKLEDGSVQEQQTPLVGWQRWAMLAPASGVLVFSVLYLLYALAPDLGPDSSYYHLLFIRRYLEHGGFLYITENFYAALSQGAELVYLIAYSVGPQSGAGLVHLSLLILASAVVYQLLRREVGNLMALCASWMLLAIPVLGKSAIYAYLEAAVLVSVLGVLWMLELWRKEGRTIWLVAAGLLTGYAYAVKYTAALIAILAVSYVIWESRSSLRKVLGNSLVLTLCAALVGMPWMIRNWIVYQNPFAPLFNRYFPNPYFMAETEEGWRNGLKTYGWFKSYWDLPGELLFDGSHLQGLIGLGFLAAPLAFLAVRSRLGRWALFGVALFLLPYPENVGTRFLTPSLAFAVVAMALASKGYPALVLVIAMVHGISSWPTVLRQYAKPEAWLLQNVPRWKQLSTNAGRAQYMEDNSTEYRMAKLLEEVAVKDGKVFTMSSLTEAYTSRRVCMSYTSAACMEAYETLRSPLLDGMRQKHLIRDSFAATDVMGVRLVVTASHESALWAFSEIQFLDKGERVQRSQDWRLRSSHYPWNLPLAFDNSPASIWFSQTPRTEGMFVEVLFDRSHRIDSIETRAAQTALFNDYRVEILKPSGQWVPVQSERTMNESDDPALGRAAMQALYRSGFRYIALYTGDYFFKELLREQQQIGIKIVGSNDTAVVFEIVAPVSDEDQLETERK